MMTCPLPEELSRAVSERDDGFMAEHVAACEHCRAEWDGALRIRALAREIASPSIDPASARQVRERLLLALNGDRRRARRKQIAAWGAFAVAATASLAVGLHARHTRDSATALHYHGTVTALPGARYVRESPRPSEVVRLEAGTIHVEVTPLDRGERFMVRAGEGEVEVRGTAFDVAVLDGHLASVQVAHGRVEVRDSGASPVVIGAGGVWQTTLRAPTEASSASSVTLSAPIPEIPLHVPSPAVRPPLRRGAVPTPSIAAPRPDVPPDPSMKSQPASAPVAPSPPLSSPERARSQGDGEERRDRREERHERADERRMR